MKIVGLKRVKSKHGLDAVVQHSIVVTENCLHIVRFVGTCGGSRHKFNVTIGSVIDKKRPAPPTAKELQATLDKYRQFVADEAAWKESVRIAFQGVN
jgi:hypothetical protein